MTVHQGRPIGSLDQAAPSSGPTVFVRTFSAPPGMPWDQARVAGLEARSGAPLPLAEVMYQVRRLEAWAPNRAGRYAAFYIRVEEAGGDLQTTVAVNGQSMRVRFLSAADRNQRVKRLALSAGVAGGLALALSGAVSSALAVREETSARLDAVEKIAAAKQRKLKAFEREQRDARALDSAGVSHERLSDVLADLQWASEARASGARIGALHWDRGHMAVEVRGEGAPFAASRTLVRAQKPLRLHVWLWGVEGPSGSAR